MLLKVKKRILIHQKRNMSKDVKSPEELQQVEQVLSKSEQFIEKNQKQLLMAVSAVVLLILLVLAFKNFYLVPREKVAANEIAKAQAAFAVDSFKVALNGNTDFAGFEEIANDYSMTASGNVAVAYAGICYFKLGQYENAVKYLSKYDGDDNYFSVAVIGLIGDAQIELGKKEEAINYFEKAAEAKNEVLSALYLKKAGIAYEALGKPNKALEKYILIRDEYPRSMEASDIEKYIARLEK